MQPKRIRKKAGTYLSPASEVTTMPPWDERREWIRLAEVPAYMKRMLGISVGVGTVFAWANKGVQSPAPGDPERRVYLVCRRAHRCKMVNKTDLLAFLNLEM